MSIAVLKVHTWWCILDSWKEDAAWKSVKFWNPQQDSWKSIIDEDDNFKSRSFFYLVPKLTKIRRGFNDLAYSSQTVDFLGVLFFNSNWVNYF